MDEKNAAVGMRADEELKSAASDVFDGLGIPTSLGVEPFLKKAVATARCPSPCPFPRKKSREEREETEAAL